MNELLRLASELVNARERATDGEWVGDGYSIYTNAVGGDYIIGGKHASEEDIEFITLAGNHAVDVIKGYQRMVEAALSLLEHAHFTREWRQLKTVADLWIKTAKESIPGVSDSKDHTNEES